MSQMIHQLLCSKCRTAVLDELNGEPGRRKWECVCGHVNEFTLQARPVDWKERPDPNKFFLINEPQLQTIWRVAKRLYSERRFENGDEMRDNAQALDGMINQARQLPAELGRPVPERPVPVMDPRWECRCGCVNIPAYLKECDSCGRPRAECEAKPEAK